MKKPVYFEYKKKQYKGYVLHGSSEMSIVTSCHNGGVYIISNKDISPRKDNRDSHGRFTTTASGKSSKLPFSYGQFEQYGLGIYSGIPFNPNHVWLGYESEVEKVTMSKTERILDIITFLIFSVLLLLSGFYIGSFIINFFK